MGGEVKSFPYIGETQIRLPVGNGHGDATSWVMPVYVTCDGGLQVLAQTLKEESHEQSMKVQADTKECVPQSANEDVSKPENDQDVTETKSAAQD